jgi:hypothetical protein
MIELNGKFYLAPPKEGSRRDVDIPGWLFTVYDAAGKVVLCRPRAVRVRGDASQVDAAGAVLDDDQGVDAPQENGVHVDEVDCENAAGLRDQELLP